MFWYRVPAVTRQTRSRTIRAYVLAFIASALTANAVLGERGAVELWRARRDYTAAAEGIAALRAANGRLRTEARLLRSDRRTIEAIARRELGLARPGEHLVLVTGARSRMPRFRN